MYEVQGRRIEMPVEVRDASSAAATFLVDAAAARRLLPGPELDVVELLPGRALFSLACVDYRDNDLGDYDEISLAFFVRERGTPRGVPFLGPVASLLRGRLPTWIQRLPVNQDFTCEAGCRIWGFPKTVEEIDLRVSGERLFCTWTSGGQRVLRVSLPARGRGTLPDNELTTYTWLDGAPHRTQFVSGAERFGFSLGGANLELGDHPVADELRSLGLPKRALFCAWMGRMHGRFEAPEKL